MEPLQLNNGDLLLRQRQQSTGLLHILGKSVKYQSGSLTIPVFKAKYRRRSLLGAIRC